MWDDLDLYKKLIMKEKGLDYNDTNEFVIMVLKVYLERTFWEFYHLLQPYTSDTFINNLYDYLFAERDKLLKKMNVYVAEIKLKRLAEQYERENKKTLPWSLESFKEAQKYLLQLDIPGQVIQYKEYLKFWQQTIIEDPALDFDGMISKKLLQIIKNEIEFLEKQSSFNTVQRNKFPTFNFDYFAVEKYSNELEVAEAIKYLEFIKTNFPSQNNFKDYYEKLMFETDLKFFN